MLDRQNGLIALFLALLSASCGDDGGSADAGAAGDVGPDTGDAGGETDAGPGPDGAIDASGDAGGGADQDGAVDEVDPTVLTNFSFDAAKPIELGPTGALQPLQSATQVDYFSFEAEAGEVYVITAHRGRFSPNNVLSFYDPQREKVAENDIGWLWPGDLVDARLVVRARESGVHFVVVEDRELTADVFEIEGLPAFFYRVTVALVEQTTPAFAWESGQDDEPAVVTFTVDPGSGVSHVTLIGELAEGETDRFQLHGGATQALIGHVHPGGVSGNGSTLIDGVVDVHDATDQLVAEIDRGLGGQFIHPPVEDADYTLSVRSDGAHGDNAFYAIDLVLLTDNPGEAATDNDTPETAEPIVLLGGFLRRGTILAEVPALDRDYFAFETMAGDIVDVICEGESAGSGVRGLKAEILDAEDTVLGEATEAIATGLSLAGVDAGEPGTHYLRLSSETPDDADAARAWVRCAVIAEP
jgi:hypothetical protein